MTPESLFRIVLGLFLIVSGIVLIKNIPFRLNPYWHVGAVGALGAGILLWLYEVVVRISAG